MEREWVPVLLLAAVAAGMDIRRGIIPNWLTVPGLAGGYVWHIARAGGQGILLATGGAVLASLIFLIPFLRGGLGGGDLKLLLALGAFLGPWNGLRAAVAAAIAGGALSLAYLLLRRVGERRSEGSAGAGVKAMEETRAAGKAHDWGCIPYGPAIAMGTAWVALAA